MNKAILGALAAAAILVTACGGGTGDGSDLKSSDQVTGHNDINPQPASNIKQGGTLQWPLDDLADNWNPYQANGTTTDATYLVNAVEPWLFVAKPDNSMAIDPDYLTSATLISTTPEVVEYKINPKARWSNGRAIDWTDFQAMWQALNGSNTAFQVSSSTGYANIGKVERGSDERDVRVTFSKDFGEWQSLFSPLTPKELNATPDAFNNAWINQPAITAGAFKIDKIDQSAKSVRMVPDPNWWGAKPHLDAILFKVVARTALADGLASGAIDFYRIGSNIDLYQRARTMSWVRIRRSVENFYNLLDFNGAPGTILADQALRVAVEKGVDAASIAKALLGPITNDPSPLGNHFFVKGTKDYQDNSAPTRFDPDAARKALDQLGWKSSGQFRAKNGKPLRLTYVGDAGNPTTQSISTLVQTQLKAIGVDVKISMVPEDELFPNYVFKGSYDIVAYGQTSPPQPISADEPLFYLTPNSQQQNYSQIGGDALNKLLDEAGSELDDGKRVALIQQADTEIWREGHLLPVYQVPGAYAVRGTLANFGAFGFAQYPIDYVDIGFTK